MYKHLDKLKQSVNIPIVRLTPKHNFFILLLKYGWPHMHLRWCTGEKKDILQLYAKSQNAINLIGFAADEKHRVNDKFVKRANAIFPLIEWGVTEKDALAYCLSKGFSWGGLYNHFSRVSCFCCPFKKIGDYRKIRKHYPELWRQMLAFDRLLVSPNRGFCGIRTVHNLDSKFAEEDRQMSLPFVMLRSRNITQHLSRPTLPSQN